MKKIITYILICLIILSSYKVVSSLYNYKADNNTYTKIKEIKDSPRKNPEDFNSILKSKNSNYMFWISIKGTTIDYPVVQGENNEFYLNHDFYKKNSISGAIFLDYRNKGFDDSNLIIYGHNMRNKSMFYDLIKFKDKSFLDKKNIITIQCSEGIKTYKIFSVYIESAYTASIKYNFASIDERKNYLNSIKTKSLYFIDDKLSEKDYIITLCTCSYEFEEARIIIHGKRIN